MCNHFFSLRGRGMDLYSSPTMFFADCIWFSFLQTRHSLVGNVASRVVRLTAWRWTRCLPIPLLVFIDPTISYFGFQHQIAQLHRHPNAHDSSLARRSVSLFPCLSMFLGLDYKRRTTSGHDECVCIYTLIRYLVRLGTAFRPRILTTSLGTSENFSFSRVFFCLCLAEKCDYHVM